MRFNKKTRKILAKRLLLTIGILFCTRMGVFLPIPGINLNDLSFYVQSHTSTKNLLTIFGGTDTFVVGLFTLSVFPFINASILVQFILSISPELKQLQKEGDLPGRRIISRLTRILTFFFSVTESISLMVYLKEILFAWDFKLLFETTVYLTTGAMIILWLSDLITDYGLGNGVSTFIYINICSNFQNLTDIRWANLFTFSTVYIFLLLYISVFLLQGKRIIPIISSKEKKIRFCSEWLVNRNYIPIRFNQTGIMPIGLTTVLLVIPTYFYNFDWLQNVEFFKWIYWVIYFALVLIFSLLYSEIVLNPKDISDQLQKMTVTIVGVRPGLETLFFLTKVLQRINLVGATILASLTTFPNILELILNITYLNKLNISSLLILVGVIIDCISEAIDIYYTNIYTNME